MSAVRVGELLDQGLRIPHYQRPYSWEPATALQLIDDVRDAFVHPDGSDASYVLGAVILHANSGGLDVVDGQQRLLTLRMIVAIVDPEDDFTLPPDTDNPVARVMNALYRRIEGWSGDQRLGLLAFIRDQCQVVRIVTDDVDEAFRVFDSQNYRGKPLAPHDLLKAHHLREMRGETDSMMSAVVETWESVNDDVLDRLFSVYLYRIARWTRGERAPGFTTHDIGMFKGVSPGSAMSPSARYHLAAQAAIPMLSAWSPAAPTTSDRESGRTRFQLDAPVPAGRPFFEMVTFMLAEVEQLRRESFSEGWEPFASSKPGSLEERPARSRYRYVSELYLAAVLYYTNKFGEEELNAARERLFAWAFTLRAAMVRVQFRSIDNHGRGAPGATSAFVLLRNAPSGRVVHQLPSSSRPYSDGHENKLVALLTELGAR